VWPAGMFVERNMTGGDAGVLEAQGSPLRHSHVPQGFGVPGFVSPERGRTWNDI